MESSINDSGDRIILTIHSFSSVEPRSAKTKEEKALSGFDLLSAVFIDRDYNGSEFVMTDAFFLDDLKQQDDGRIIELEKFSTGKRMMVVYTDIFGNDLTESVSL